MFLAVDVGNTQTTLGLLAEGKICARWRLKTDHADTADELHARLSKLLELKGFKTEMIGASAIASVVPALTNMWRIALLEALHTEPYVVRGQSDCCMPIDMPYPEQVGADRIANAVEARHTYGSPAIVVDFGTATNIDVVDASGAYRGGCIAPGLMLSASALFSRAAKLASTPIEAPPAAIGDTTEHAIQSGLVLGVAAQAEGLVFRIKQQMINEAKSDEERSAVDTCSVIATGGLSTIIEKATDIFDVVDTDLTLRGIWRIWYLHHR